MNRLELIGRVRSLTRDLSNSIFREVDIVDYINEGIDRIKQLIPEFAQMESLISNTSVPTMLPAHYHHLIAVYSASRCFAQDERAYQASTLMNEFEQKVEELKQSIEDGRTKILDPITGFPVTGVYEAGYVTENYFEVRNASTFDLDEGIEGVE
jgi:hypothetical protein